MTKTRVGVVIARMQTPHLTEGHNWLIRYVQERNSHLIILLGTSVGKLTTSNPMDYETRRIMVQDSHPHAIISWLPDSSSDQRWSEHVDTIIKHLLKTTIGDVEADVELYASRDSFIKHYSGGYRTQELESPCAHVSATLLRNAVSKMPLDTVDFRKGVIYAAYNRYPTAYPVMDVAITKDNGRLLLLCTKSKYDKLQFIGGFFDVTKDKSMEDTVHRETMEETGLQISKPSYITSMLVDDWRYKGTKDKIITNLYHAAHVSGIPVASDDLVAGTVDWYKVENLMDYHMADVHKPLLQAFLQERNRFFAVKDSSVI